MTSGFDLAGVNDPTDAIIGGSTPDTAAHTAGPSSATVGPTVSVTSGSMATAGTNTTSARDLALALLDESKQRQSGKRRRRDRSGTEESAKQPSRRGRARREPQARAAAEPASYPRDWRWFVGGLGRILISLGLLIFAFVGYQLVGTGIQYTQAQNKLRSEFEAKLAGFTPPPPVAEIAASTTAAGDPATTVAADPATSAAPAAEEPAPPPPPLVADPLPPINLGESIAYIEIPAIGLDDVLVAGVRTEDLKKGVGHFPFSPMPGQPGNAALAGHRTTFGQPFFNIDKLVNGDEIIITTLQGRYVYRVTGQSIVQPSDGQVVANQPDKKMLTLTSCNPKFSARERIVITADLDEPASSPMGVATSNYKPLAADGSAVPLPEELPTEDTLVDATVDPATTAPGEVAATAVPVAEAPPVTELDLGAALDDTEAQAADALEAGWFSDPDAWPQVAMWGAALSLVAIAAWRLSKLVRRNWVGALVGIAPFVVVLYFFFENVNRLLPPNL